MRYLAIAKGSAGELRSQLYLLQKASKLDQTNYDLLYKDLVQISGELKGFIKYLSEFD